MFNANEVVTSENLNNVAIDLGASTFGTFTEGVPYAVTELNNITKELTSKGILYILNKCKPSLSGNTVTVDTGVIAFADGSKIRITEVKTFVLDDTTTASYIYAVKNIITNNITLQSTSAPITQGEFVPICKIENNKLTDIREMSYSKVGNGTTLPQTIYVSNKISETEVGSDVAAIYEEPLLNPNARVLIGIEVKKFSDIGRQGKVPLCILVLNEDGKSGTSYQTEYTSGGLILKETPNTNSFKMIINGSTKTNPNQYWGTFDVTAQLLSGKLKVTAVRYKAFNNNETEIRFIVI